MCEGVVAKHISFCRTIADDSAQFVSEVTVERLFGGCLVQSFAFEYKAYLVERSGGGEVIHFGHGELHSVAFGGGLRRRALVEHHLAVFLKVDKVGVSASDDGSGL